MKLGTARRDGWTLLRQQRIHHGSDRIQSFGKLHIEDFEEEGNGDDEEEYCCNNKKWKRQGRNVHEGRQFPSTLPRICIVPFTFLNLHSCS